MGLVWGVDVDAVSKLFHRQHHQVFAHPPRRMVGGDRAGGISCQAHRARGELIIGSALLAVLAHGWLDGGSIFQKPSHQDRRMVTVGFGDLIVGRDRSSVDGDVVCVFLALLVAMLLVESLETWDRKGLGRLTTLGLCNRNRRRLGDHGNFGRSNSRRSVV